MRTKKWEVNGVTTEMVVHPIVVDNIGVGNAEYKKEKSLTAQLRQLVVTKTSYPGTKVTSNMQSSLYKTEDFGFEAKEFETTENRMAFIYVPEKATLAEVKALIEEANKNNATIYRVLADRPILDNNQQFVVDSGVQTLDFFAGKQIARIPKNAKTIEEGTVNNIIKQKKDNNIFYRRTFYWETPREDEDKRGTTDVYMSPEIIAELQGAAEMEAADQKL